MGDHREEGGDGWLRLARLDLRDEARRDAERLRDTPEAQEACAQLVALANGAGGIDNISVIVVNV